ncbi:hypothetical protein [Chitinimonas koreensis]|uniref:hypothetical protein n=1 Tax=Chitinimonas koreensis TaxID=356302 RepID=UPI0012FBBF29|nr:hypothetical protein [Chitinimonas koreensis]QNM96751.1 hypothetical protein H9L41_23905 [Chitinimonas koreensis]
MERIYRVTPEKAYLSGGWSDEVRQLLLTHRPRFMELAEDWSDLSVFDGLVDDVVHLKIAGSIKNGQIKAANGLEVFRGMKRLTLVSRVKAGLDVAALRKLESFSGLWQPEVKTLLSSSALQSVTLHAVPGDALSSFPENSSISSLWLANTTATSLKGLSALSALSELRITDAKQLESLDGIEDCPVSVLDIESARKLVDFSALRSIEAICRLRLLFVSQEADVTTFAELQGLRWLHFSGKDVPPLDWLSVAPLPHIERIVGWWDEAVAPEAAIHNAVRAGRKIVKFEPIGKLKIRPLDIELADIA